VLTQIDQKNTYVYMKHKSKIIMQLVKTCSEYNRSVNSPDMVDEESSDFLYDVIIWKSLRMLSNKQLEKLIVYTKNKIT
jgi:hypothetical protein